MTLKPRDLQISYKMKKVLIAVFVIILADILIRKLIAIAVRVFFENRNGRLTTTQVVYLVDAKYLSYTVIEILLLILLYYLCKKYWNIGKFGRYAIIAIVFGLMFFLGRMQ